MLILPFFSRFLPALAVGVLLACGGQAQSDPLPSWNDGAARQAIVTFCECDHNADEPELRAAR